MQGFKNNIRAAVLSGEKRNFFRRRDHHQLVLYGKTSKQAGAQNIARYDWMKAGYKNRFHVLLKTLTAGRL